MAGQRQDGGWLLKHDAATCVDKHLFGCFTLLVRDDYLSCGRQQKVFPPLDKSTSCFDPMQRYIPTEEGRFVKFEPGFVFSHSDHCMRGSDHCS